MRHLAALALLLLTSLSPALGQSTSASLTSRISDPVKALVFAARVSDVNDATGVRNETSTGDSGEYQLANLQQGKYRLEIEKSGFKKLLKPNVFLHVNDLPPGGYRFIVRAANNSGVWNESSTAFDFIIGPAYYQSTWFRVVVLILFVLGLVGIYQIRLRQVARQVHERMEERLEERERIARDLHDTLLQGVQGLILKFHAISNQIPKDTPAYSALQTTLDHADAVLAEGRDSIRNLRVNSASLNDLPAAFRLVAEETSQGRDAIFKTVVEGHVRDLHPLVQEECYHIGREAIINALTHSEGRQVEAEIAYDSRQFRVRVRDNGRGIDRSILEAGERAGHFGLQGMRERTQKIGGHLRLWSRPETGTEVELTVPGATAYQSSSHKLTKLWFGHKKAQKAQNE